MTRDDAGDPYQVADASGSALNTLLAAVRATHVNGGALLGRFRAVTPVTAPWFSTSSNLARNQSFTDLLGTTTARTALADLRLPDPWPLAAPPVFHPSATGTLTLDGEWAHLLVRGGAYSRFSGTAAQAKALAGAAVHELVQDRHEDMSVFGSDEAWTPWFRDVAWDSTWVVVDEGRREVTVLCVTDTD